MKKKVAQSSLPLCDPMDCSTRGLPGHHQLLEFTQNHVHRAGDAIQPSHPLSSPSPPAFNLSQHQGLSRWVSSSNQVAKGLEYPLALIYLITGCLHLWTTILQRPLPLHPSPLYPPIWSSLFFSLSYCLLLKYNWPTTLSSWCTMQWSDNSVHWPSFAFKNLFTWLLPDLNWGTQNFQLWTRTLTCSIWDLTSPRLTQGSNPSPLNWECSVLATEPLGKLMVHFLSYPAITFSHVSGLIGATISLGNDRSPNWFILLHLPIYQWVVNHHQLIIQPSDRGSIKINPWDPYFSVWAFIVSVLAVSNI